MSSLGAFSRSHSIKSLHSNKKFYITYEHHNLNKCVHMKYNHKTSHFHASISVQNHGYTLNTHKHIFHKNIGYYSYDSKHTFMNIFITETHYIPIVYQTKYPTYESMGSSEREYVKGNHPSYRIHSY